MKKLPSGGYEVGHSAQVIGFNRDVRRGDLDPGDRRSATSSTTSGCWWSGPGEDRGWPSRTGACCAWISTVARPCSAGCWCAGALKVIDPQASVAAVRAYELLPAGAGDAGRLGPAVRRDRARPAAGRRAVHPAGGRRGAGPAGRLHRRGRLGRGPRAEHRLRLLRRRRSGGRRARPRTAREIVRDLGLLALAAGWSGDRAAGSQSDEPAADEPAAAVDARSRPRAGPAAGGRSAAGSVDLLAVGASRRAGAVGGGIGFQAWRTGRAPSAAPTVAAASVGSGRPSPTGSPSSWARPTRRSRSTCTRTSTARTARSSRRSTAQILDRRRSRPARSGSSSTRCPSSTRARPPRPTRSPARPRPASAPAYYAGLFANQTLHWSDDQLIELAEQVERRPYRPAFSTCVTEPGARRLGRLDQRRRATSAGSPAPRPCSSTASRSTSPTLTPDSARRR